MSHSTNEEQSADFREAVTRIETLYSTPQILGRAMKLVRRTDVGLNQIVDLVNLDQSLTADLLHLSNTALFRRGEPCTRLSDALQRLGINELIRMICLSLSKNLFGKDLAFYGITASQYWTESVWSALVMESLARSRHMDPSEAYVVGLLSQIGKVLINEALLGKNTALLWDGRKPVEAWEIEYVGFTHAAAGPLLLRRWEFPESIVRPISEQLEQPQEQDMDSLTGLLRASRVCLAATDPAVVVRVWRAPISDEFAGWFGYRSAKELRSALETVTAQVRDIRRQL